MKYDVIFTIEVRWTAQFSIFKFELIPHLDIFLFEMQNVTAACSTVLFNYRFSRPISSELHSNSFELHSNSNDFRQLTALMVHFHSLSIQFRLMSFLLNFISFNLERYSFNLTTRSCHSISCQLDRRSISSQIQFLNRHTPSHFERSNYLKQACIVLCNSYRMFFFSRHIHLFYTVFNYIIALWTLFYIFLFFQLVSHKTSFMVKTYIVLMYIIIHGWVTTVLNQLAWYFFYIKLRHSSSAAATVYNTVFYVYTHPAEQLVPAHPFDHAVAIFNTGQNLPSFQRFIFKEWQCPIFKQSSSFINIIYFSHYYLVQENGRVWSFLQSEHFYDFAWTSLPENSAVNNLFFSFFLRA